MYHKPQCLTAGTYNFSAISSLPTNAVEFNSIFLFPLLTLIFRQMKTPLCQLPVRNLFLTPLHSCCLTWIDCCQYVNRKNDIIQKDGYSWLQRRLTVQWEVSCSPKSINFTKWHFSYQALVGYMSHFIGAAHMHENLSALIICAYMFQVERFPVTIP